MKTTTKSAAVALVLALATTVSIPARAADCPPDHTAATPEPQGGGEQRAMPWGAETQAERDAWFELYGA